MNRLETSADKTRFETRLPVQQKLLFEKAAAYGGFNSLSEFILSTVHKKAVEIIKEHELILVSQRDREVFFDAIINPPQPNEALKQAAQKFLKFGKNDFKNY